jgi:hypothetical protein
VLSGSLDFRLRGYRGITGTVGAMSPSRDDVVFAATARAQYVLTERYYLTGTYVGSIDQTDFTYPTVIGPDDPSYTRHELMFGARAAF